MGLFSDLLDDGGARPRGSATGSNLGGARRRGDWPERQPEPHRGSGVQRPAYLAEPTGPTGYSAWLTGKSTLAADDAAGAVGQHVATMAQASLRRQPEFTRPRGPLLRPVPLTDHHRSPDPGSRIDPATLADLVSAPSTGVAERA